MTYSHVGHDSCIRGTWLLRMWDIFLLYVGHDSFITWAICSTLFRCLFFFTRFGMCVIWLTDMFEITYSHVGHGSFIRGTWLIHTWDTSHSFVGHDSSIRGTRLIHTCDTTHSYVWHDSFIRGTQRIHTWDMTHSYAGTWLTHAGGHDSSILQG